MPTPQISIFEEGHRHHYVLEYMVFSKVSTVDIRVALQNAWNNVGNHEGVTLAFGSIIWGKLSPDSMPKGFAPLKSIEGADGHHMPATNADILFKIQADNWDDVFDTVQAIQSHMQKVAKISLDQQGFIYKDSRDLIGFVDGSANPKDDQSKRATALIADGEPFAGGAFVLTQKWVHDLPSFNQLDIPAQEAVIGRTKTESIELEGDAMLATSHVSRTDVKIDGVGQKIWRTSFSFGNAQECGLYFVCFACHPSRVQVQLDRMYGVSGDGLHDQLIHYTKPITGSFWFAPALEDLTQILEG